MHQWGDDSVDWVGLEQAAWFIGEKLKTWGRVSVSQYKEKYGTVRVYCNFGWYDLNSVAYPGCISVRKTWMTYVRLDWLNWLVIPIQVKVYRHLYRSALECWPHLRAEILDAADWPEYLEGL